jgi:hypothetical protein
MNSRLWMSMLAASTSAITGTAVLSLPARAQPHQNTQHHQGTEPQRALPPQERLPHTAPAHPTDQQGSASHQATQPQRATQPQAINTQQAAPPQQVTQPHQTDNKGGPKINTGVSGGNTTAGTVPGAGPSHSGTYTAPQQPGQPTAPAGTLYDPKTARPGSSAPGSEGKTVTPGDFSRDKQIRELTDPKGGLPAPASNPLTDRTNANPLDGFPTGGPARGADRNTVGKTGQQSVTASADPDKGTVTLKGNRGEAEFQLSKDGTKLERETITVKDKDATITIVNDHETKTTTSTVTMTTGQIYTKINDGEWKRTKTPNPENDPGDGHAPKGVANDRPLKSPGEIEAERKHEATLPPDDQSRQLERMRMDAETALKSAANQRTAGRIDPGPSGDGTTTSLGTGPLPVTDPRNPSNPTGSSLGGTKPPKGDPTEACAANKSC